ncbi:Hypothetical protein PROPJV5_2181 [Propionibacterium ruminifibrarum]|uniref:Uncharacterized protein n=1 Tax=Propionibacterium ruminifibrarum TaxID=1962131 RepID=A0A375I4W7_9ACTN|nr:hypothetical protein [Propionibacterium ruminifibrarum]SPF69220.1 Hypothetical protein PROPJV5_2181 [Propionibacterium ruminifibrarum]
MFLFVIATVLILLVALCIGLIVVVGMQGYRREENKKLYRRLNRIAVRMNGDVPRDQP